MSFKVRNTIALAIFFLVITAAGAVYWLVIQPRSLKSAEKEIARLERELQEMPAVLAEVEARTRELADVKRRYDSRSKVVPLSDNTSESFEYVNNSVEQAGALKFNMQFNGTQTFGQYGYNQYSIEEGEASFDEFYRMLYYLENGSVLYKINQVTVSLAEELLEEGKSVRHFVSFNFKLYAYYSSVPELATSLAAKSLSPATVPPDPFSPLILEKIATVPPEGEIDPQQLDIRAVVPGKAFALYQDELLILQVGDRVWRGVVSRVAPQEGKIECTVNEGGIIKTIERKIQFKKKVQR